MTFPLPIHMEVITKWSQNTIQLNLDFQETPLTTTTPPNLPPQITTGIHAFLWQISIKHQQSTKHCSGDITVENTKSPVHGPYILMVRGGTMETTENVHFLSRQMLWGKSNLGVAGGGEGHFAAEAHVNLWAGSINPGTWILRQKHQCELPRAETEVVVNEGQSDRRGGQVIRGGRLGETLYLTLCSSDPIPPAKGSHCGVNRTISTASLRVTL